MQLIEDIGVYKSCSYIELIFLYTISIAIILPIFILIPVIPIGIGIIVSIIVAVFLMGIIATKYQDKKRNKSAGFYTKKMALIFNGFFGIKINTATIYSPYCRYLD